MGLLEKAFRYKTKTAGEGKKSIMDRIAGPADEGAHASGREDTLRGDDLVYLDKGDLVEVKTDDAASDSPSPGGNAMLDYMTLFELSRDILRAESESELFDVMLFSIMGQIGVSSSSIMVPGAADGDSWVIAESRGVTIDKTELSLSPSRGILEQVISRGEIIDIEDFKDQTEYLDEYYAYIAIDARLLVPVMDKNEVMGVIILGNKLTGEDYTADEKDFFASIAEFSAYSYRSVLIKGREASAREKSTDGGFNELQEKMLADPRSGTLTEMVRNKFKDFGVEGFALFLRDEFAGGYRIFTCEEEDRLQLGKAQYEIPFEASLITEIARTRDPLTYHNPSASQTIERAFPDGRLRMLRMLTIYTYRAEGDLIGFTMVFSSSDQPRDGIPDRRIARYCNLIFPYIHVIRSGGYRSRSYIDSAERILGRVNEEIRYASELQIPVVLLVLVMKNYKRLHEIFGIEKTGAVFKHAESFIKTRLSGRDFSVRYDRHKILIVLTGKDKKYAALLANTIINELVQTHSTRDVQLLITYSAAEFPSDGRDPNALFDAVS
jgi:GGDEF domain-containing protein